MGMNSAGVAEGQLLGLTRREGDDRDRLGQVEHRRGRQGAEVAALDQHVHHRAAALNGEDLDEDHRQRDEEEEGQKAQRHGDERPPYPGCLGGGTPDLARGDGDGCGSHGQRPWRARAQACSALMVSSMMKAATSITTANHHQLV